MASYNLTMNPASPSATTDPHKNSDQDVCRIVVTSSSWNNENSNLTVNFKIEYKNDYGIGGVRAWVNGNQAYNNVPSEGYYLISNNSDHTSWTQLGTGSYTVSTTRGSTATITIKVRAIYGGVYYASRLNDGYTYTGTHEKSSSYTVGVPGDPSVTIAVDSKTSASRAGSNGSARGYCSASSAGTNGGSLSYSYNVGGTTGTSSTCTGTGLKNNTNYTASVTVTNSYGRTASSSVTFYLTPVAPTCTCTSSSIARTTATLGNSGATYDTNRKASSITYQYGTSTSYGSTSSNGSLTGLTPNTTYHARAVITDANNGGPYTSALTGYSADITFKTTGNAPTVTSSHSSLARTSVTITAAATYDTNASFSSGAIQYGTTTSYGTNVTITSSALSKSITGLTPNTTYHYRAYITDNQGRTGYSADHTFTTTGNAPTVTSSHSSVARTSVTITAATTYDTNASFSSGAIQYGTSTSYGTNVTITASALSKSITGLAANTTYHYRAYITDNYSRTGYSADHTFTTTGNAPTVSASATDITPTTASITYSATFDTNASRSSASYAWGTTTSYANGSGTISDNSGTISLSGLIPNTTYYFKVTYTDNFNRTTTKTGSFTTKAGVYIKNSGTWYPGVTYIKVNGAWKEATGIYFKVNGSWIQIG